MCGRFGISFSKDEIADRFELTETPEFNNSYNVAPSQLIPAITRNSPKKAVMMYWGFIPSWSDPQKTKFRPINAREDSLGKPFYKDSLKNTRCIIPFSFFYEWKRFEKDGREEKLPYLIRVKEGQVMGFAGIYSEHKDAEDMPYFSCAIITTKPNKLVSRVHNRMPAILDQETEDKWLNSEDDTEKIKSLIKPYPAERMEMWRVGKAVNNPEIDSPDLVKPEGKVQST